MSLTCVNDWMNLRHLLENDWINLCHLLENDRMKKANEIIEEFE